MSFLASKDILFLNLGGTSLLLFLAGVCSSGLSRCLVFITVACSLTRSYSRFIRPLDTNLSTRASARFWSLVNIEQLTTNTISNCIMVNVSIGSESNRTLNLFLMSIHDCNFSEHLPFNQMHYSVIIIPLEV